MTDFSHDASGQRRQDFVAATGVELFIGV